MAATGLVTSIRAGTCLVFLGLGSLAVAADPVDPAMAEEVKAASEEARSMAAEEPGVASTDAEPAHEPEAGEARPNAPEGSRWPTERPPMPFEVMRSLQYLQDQAARGNKAALQVQRRLLNWFEPSLAGRARDIWSDKRNVRAVLLYVLSGGPSKALVELRRAGVFDAADDTLIDGVVAYARNETVLAEEKLSAVDLRHEETVFAAQINLALARLREATDPAGALHLLETVMLMAPGTLLEEAALRLGVLMAEDAGETRKADRYARQYFDRYASSIYSENFRARFSAVYSGRPPGSEEETLATLADTMRLLPEDQKLAMYLSVARRALVGGNLQLSGASAERALAFADASPADRQRGLLYQIASTLSTREEGEIRATLAAIDDELLHQSDRALKTAALDVVAAIREPATLASTAETDEPELANTTLTRAASLLEAVDKDLEGLGP